MILILGGTTEGRLAVSVIDAAGSPYWYSTRGDLQQIDCLHGTRITGAMDEAAMSSFCEEQGIRLIVDAAHPFASQLHATVAAVAQSLRLPVIRVERIYPDEDPDLHWCADYDDAMAQLERDGIDRLLALTGVQTIARLKPYWSRHDCRFRILQRDESLQKAAEAGFPKDRLVYYAEGDEADVIAAVRPEAVLTKESGESGGFGRKVAAARAAGIPVYVVRRPVMPEGFETVTGGHGLRKAVERLLPGFFPLRSGFTTGACATAASKAALLALLGRPAGDDVEITFPDGERLSLPVADCRRISAQSATAAVVKDAGDDPDVTNGISVVATVSFSPHPGVRFLQGEGVGRVTLPGLGLPIGGAAINKVPRSMMERELSSLYQGGLDVVISVPGGRELARRTFNPKLGIEDGISIIGTSGIVQPFSNEAFTGSIRREMEVAVAVGSPMLVINSGARSEAAVKALYPDLPAQAFVHYGNFIGETLGIAAELGIGKVVMGIMLGKAVKLAEGNLDTHSRNVVMNKTFLKSLADGAGCSVAVAAAIDNMTLARELWQALDGNDAQRFFTALTAACAKVCAGVYPPSAGCLTILLMDESGNVRFRA